MVQHQALFRFTERRPVWTMAVLKRSTMDTRIVSGRARVHHEAVHARGLSTECVGRDNGRGARRAPLWRCREVARRWERPTRRVASSQRDDFSIQMRAKPAENMCRRTGIDPALQSGCFGRCCWIRLRNCSGYRGGRCITGFVKGSCGRSERDAGRSVSCWNRSRRCSGRTGG